MEAPQFESGWLSIGFWIPGVSMVRELHLCFIVIVTCILSANMIALLLSMFLVAVVVVKNLAKILRILVFSL
jgi:hypothetical protein